MPASPASPPLVSVILCTYNGEAYIEEALQSVLNQSCKDFEFRILDDGSTDKTVELIEHWAARDSRIIFKKNSQNRGTGYTYSNALKDCVGNYIAEIGQDDRWHPEFLEAVSSHLSLNPNCTAALTRVRIIDGSGAQNDTVNPFHYEWLRAISQEQLVCLIFKQNFICAAASVFRRSSIAGWKTLGDNDQLQDWNTWLHLIVKGEFHLNDSKLVDYRIHGSNLSIGGASSVLTKIELLQTRMQFLLSDEFWAYVKSRPDSNGFLEQIIRAYFEVMDSDLDDHWQVLFYALRSRVDEFRDLQAMNDILGLLFWRAGAFAKARRYFTSESMVRIFEGLPPRICKVFKYHWFITFAPGLQPGNSNWVQQYRLGPFKILRLWAFRPRRIPIILPTLNCNLSAKSLDRYLEHNYSKRALPRRIAGYLMRLLRSNKKSTNLM